MAKLVHPDGVSVVHHDGREYRPDRRGVFTVPDHIVPALRPHGLKTLTEIDAAETAAAEADAHAQAVAEIADLRAALVQGEVQITDLEKQLAEANQRIADLDGQLTAAQAQIAELQGQLTAATAPKKGGKGDTPPPDAGQG